MVPKTAKPCKTIWPPPKNDNPSKTYYTIIIYFDGASYENYGFQGRLLLVSGSVIVCYLEGFLGVYRSDRLPVKKSPNKSAGIMSEPVIGIPFLTKDFM